MLCPMGYLEYVFKDPMFTVLSNLLMVCLGVVSFVFLMLGLHQAASVCGFIVFIKLENFSPLFIQILFFCSFSSLWTSITRILHGLKRSHNSLILCLLLIFVFFCFCASFWIVYITVFNFSNLFFPSQYLVCP